MKFFILLPTFFFSIYIFSQNPTCGFDFSKTITIDGAQISGGPHVDFPVLISHIDADLTTAAAKVTSASGFDIIFADDNGALLDFQLESYNGVTGEIVAWVKLPSLTNGTDVDIHMLYGKSTIVTDQSTNAVWDANYTGVWHMNQDPSGAAPQITEVSGGGDNGTSNGTMTAGDLVVGKNGNGIDFDGIDDFIDLGDVLIDGNDRVTIEAWINPTSLPVKANPTGHNSNEGAIIHKNGNTDDNLGVTFASGATAFYIDEGSDNTLKGAVVPTSAWTHIVVTWNNSRMRIYQNGVLDVSLNSVNGSFVNNNNSLRFGGAHGNAGGNPHYFNGIIDEIRISNNSRGANYIATTFNSQNQPTTTVGVVTAGDFYFISTERDLTFNSNNNGDWDNAGTWVGANVPVEQFDNVIITNHDVDIDGGSGDYTICSCTINGDGSSNAYLDINSTRIFTVKEDITVNYSGAGATPARLRAFSSSEVNIAGDLILNSVNTDLTQDLYLRLRNNATINVGGDLNASLTTGKDLDIDLEDNSTLNIGGDLNLSQSGGELLILKTDEFSSIDITGNLTVTQSGGIDLLIYVNDNVGGDASFTVDGTSNFSKTGGDDIVLRTNGTNSTLTLSGNTTIDCPSAADSESLTFDSNDGLITLSNVTASRSLDMGEIDFDLDGGNITITSLTATSSGTLGGLQLIAIDLDANSIFTCTGNISVNMTGGDDFRIGLNRNNGTDAIFNCNGNLTVTQSGGDDINFFVYQQSQLNIGGNLSITQTGGEEIEIDLDNDGAMNVTGNFTIIHSEGQNGEIDIQAGSTATFNLTNNLIVNNNAGDDNFEFDVNGGSFNVGGNVTLNNSSAGTLGDVNFLIDNDGIANITGNIIANNIGGDDITIRNGNAAGSTSQLNVTGDITLNQNQATTTRNTNLIVYNGATTSCNNLNMNYTSGSLLLTELDQNGVLTVNGNIDFNTGSSGTAEIRVDGNSELRIAGNFDRTPSSFGELDMAPTGTLEFFGSAAQVFPEDAGGGGDQFDYGIVEINNSSAANPQITMEGNATVHGGMIWIDGVVASTPTELLIFDDNASTSGASNASHCDGQVQKIGDDVFTFPTGDNDYYGGIEINALSSQLATDVFTAQYFEAQHPESYFSKLGYETAGGITDGMEQTSRVEYWELTRDNGSCEPVVRLYWSDNARSDISDLSSLVVAHNTAVKTWKNEGGNTGGVLANGFVESTTKVTTFSPFTFGSLDASNNDLPIELVSFTAVLNDGIVDLNWTTASEINNEYFEVENSKDGMEWQVVAKQDGAGNSIQLLHYEDKDYAPLSGVSYYRLKQVDYDGQFAHSKVVKVTNENGSINIFPNPNNGQFQVTLESIENSFQIICYDVAGKRIELDYSVNNNTININTPLSAGIYVLSVLSDNNIYSERITVK